MRAMGRRVVRMQVLPALAAAAALALPLAACSSRLIGGLDEGQANEVMAALEQEGIGARKERDGKGRGAAFAVTVDRGDFPAAVALLGDAGLPRPKGGGMALLAAPGGLIPTAGEQAARQAAAVSEELSRTLEKMRGVVEARVLVAPAPGGGAGLAAAPEGAPAATASVLVRHRGSPSFEAGDVQRLVAGAVAGMKPQDVTVVLNDAGTGKAGRALPAYRRVGPFLVAPSSSALLSAVLAALSAVNCALAALLVAGLLRLLRGRRRAAAPPERART